MTILHGFHVNGSLIIWVVGEGPAEDGGRYFIRVYVQGAQFLEKDVQVNSEFVDHKNLHIGTLVIPNIVFKLEGKTTDLSIQLFRNGIQIGAPVPFVVPVVA